MNTNVYDLFPYFPWNGYYLKHTNNKGWNFINKHGVYLSDFWFDRLKILNDQFIIIESNKKYNLINNTGKLIFKTWYDDLYAYDDSIISILHNNKSNIINLKQSCQPISNIWFDWLSYIDIDHFIVSRNNKRYILNIHDINTTYMYFDDILIQQDNTSYAVVKLNNKYNYYIIKEKKLLSKFWFDHACYFDDNFEFADIRINSNWYSINKFGNVLHII